jgi:type II secretion system protein J
LANPNPTTATKPGRSRGFSLIEVMVALVLTALVTVGISMALRTGLDASDRIRERSDAHAEARSALHTLATDLRAAFLSGVNTEETYFTAEAAAPGASFLRFTTLSYRRSGGSTPAAGGPRSDAVQVEYSLQPSPSGGPSTLIRRERWLTEMGQGERETVCDRVASLRLRYLADDGSQDAWRADPEENPPLTVYKGEEVSTPRRKLPRGVEITLLLSPPAGAFDGARPRAYRTVVPVQADTPVRFEPEVVPRPSPGSPQGGNEQDQGGNPGG